MHFVYIERESYEEEDDLLQENTGRHELSFHRPPVLDVRHILASFKVCVHCPLPYFQIFQVVGLKFCDLFV